MYKELGLLIKFRRPCEAIMQAEAIEAIQEQFQLHRKTCAPCAASRPCHVGMELAAKIQGKVKPQISADAEFIADKIVRRWRVPVVWWIPGLTRGNGVDPQDSQGYPTAPV
jgi:hypothetical protein